MRIRRPLRPEDRPIKNEDLFVQPTYPPRALEQPLVDGAAAGMFNARESLVLFDEFNEAVERLSMKELVHKVFEQYLARVAALPDPQDKHLMMYWINTHTGGGNRLPQLAWAHYESAPGFDAAKMGFKFDETPGGSVALAPVEAAEVAKAQGLIDKLKSVDWGTVDDKFVMTLSVITAITTLALMLRKVVTKFRVLRYMVPAVSAVGDDFEEAAKKIRQVQMRAHRSPFMYPAPFEMESIQEGWISDLGQAIKAVYTMVSLYFTGRKFVEKDPELAALVGPYFAKAAPAIAELSAHAEATPVS